LDRSCFLISYDLAFSAQYAACLPEVEDAWKRLEGLKEQAIRNRKRGNPVRPDLPG
jgi:hypothetical protein